MEIPVFIVDAFTSEPFRGNPAGICLLENELSSEVYQKIASELKHSETAFLIKKAQNHYNLRWFTPHVEVNICGHATLASAHVLLKNNLVDQNLQIDFSTKSGVLTAKQKDNFIQLDFPQKTINIVDKNNDIELIKKIFNITPVYVGYGEDRYLIELEDECQIKELNPDFSILKKEQIDNYIVTAKAKNAKYDFLSRFFAPKVGVREDPVTGSAHCYLGPYWGNKLNKTSLTGLQQSTRSGVVRCDLIENNRILLNGQAVTVISGKMVI